jgi:hypothetical protein
MTRKTLITTIKKQKSQVKNREKLSKISHYSQVHNRKCIKSVTYGNCIGKDKHKNVFLNVRK